MPGMGPPPSANRRRTNADTFTPTDTVAADGRTRGPALKGTYSAQTRAWYTTWRKSPQSLVFTPTDWQRLTMLAPLVDLYFREPDVKLLTEIRQNESLLGATHLDRLRGRMKVEQVAKSRPTAVAAPSDDYRRRLGVA